MKKNKLFLFLVALGCFIFLKNEVNALTIETSNLLCRNESGEYSSVGTSCFYEKKFTGNINGYCISGWNVDAPIQNTDCSINSNIGIDDSILYANIIKYGKKQKTGYAAWYFIEDMFDIKTNNRSQSGSSNPDHASVNDITAAQNAANVDKAIYNSTNNQGYNVTKSLSSLNFTKSGTNYVATVTVTAPNFKNFGTCTVTGIEGGTATTSAINSNSGTVTVTVPIANVSQNATIAVTCNGNVQTYYKSDVYACTGYQSLATEPTEGQKQFNFSIQGSIKNSKVTISKTDATGQKELPGATLSILGSDNKVLNKCVFDKTNHKITYSTGSDAKACTWKSEDVSYVMEGLPTGKYYLVEDIAPEGYEKSSEKIEIEINENGAVKDKVSMKNAPKKVPVPDTLSARSAIILTIALLSIASGIGAFLYVKHKKANS